MNRIERAQRVKIAQLVAKLCLTRHVWAQRDTVSHEIEDDDLSRVTLHTLDVDATFIDDVFSVCPIPYVYIPLKWRTKGGIDELTCTTADGRSLHILNHSFSEFLTEWLFWQVSKCYGYTPSSLPLIAMLVRRGIKATKDEIESLLSSVDALFDSHGDPQERQRHRVAWGDMQEAPYIRKLWELVLGHHIVVARVPPNTDYSILRLTERHYYHVPPGARLNPFDAVCALKFEGPQVPLTKMKVPKDMRMLHGFGVASNLTDMGFPMEASTLGDGIRAVHQSRREGGASSWTAFVVPRRTSELLLGLITSGVSLLFVASYFGHNTGDLNQDDTSTGTWLRILLVLIPNVLSAIFTQNSHSPLYQAIMAKYRIVTLLVTALALLFPLLPVGQPSEISWLPGLPGFAEHLVLWTSGHLRIISLLTICCCFLAFGMSLASASPTLSAFVRRLRRRVTDGSPDGVG